MSLKKEHFPDYFGSYNNSALMKKGKKSGAFNSFCVVEFDDLGDSPEGTRLSVDLIIA